MSRCLSFRSRLGAPCQRTLVASTPSIASGHAMSRYATRLPPVSCTGCWRTGGGRFLHARSTRRSNTESGRRPSTVGASEHASEASSATRAGTINPFERLTDPLLAHALSQRIVERLLDAVVALHDRTQVAQGACDVRARDVVDKCVVVRIPRPVAVHLHARHRGKPAGRHRDVNSVVGEPVKAMETSRRRVRDHDAARADERRDDESLLPSPPGSGNHEYSRDWLEPCAVAHPSRSRLVRDTDFGGLPSAEALCCEAASAATAPSAPAAHMIPT